MRVKRKRWYSRTRDVVRLIPTLPTMQHTAQ